MNYHPLKFSCCFFSPCYLHFSITEAGTSYGPDYNT